MKFDSTIGLSSSTTSATTPVAPTFSLVVQIPHANLSRLLCLQSTLSSTHYAAHASLLGEYTCIASSS